MFKTLKIFISYRRENSSGYAGRIYENLKDDFDVFFDIDGINIGSQFKRTIEKEIKSSRMVLALLDKDSILEFEKRQNKDDFVLFELEYAHKNSIPIVPLLINGYPMPTVESLPKSLEFLPYLNAFDIRHEKFSDDIKSLKRKIYEKFGKFGKSKIKRILLIFFTLFLLFLSIVSFNKELKEFLLDINNSIQHISNFIAIDTSNTNNISIEYKKNTHE
jgi:hypothetical protein